MAGMTDNDGRRRISVAEMAGYVFGAVYVLVGLLGFAVTGGDGFTAREGGKLLGLFEVNPLHNIVHLLVGAALLWGAMKGVNAARSINTTVGATYLLVGVVGFFLIGNDANILALNTADNFLHLASAAVLLTAGLLGVPRTDATRAGTTTRTTTGTGSRH